jgi:prevent-host-death family protein
MTRVSVKEARDHIKTLLDRVESGEEILILRRGKEVARLVPVSGIGESLPSLREFRKSVRLQGKPMSRVVIEERRREQY